MNILVVDDSNIDRMIAATLLRNAKHNALEAVDGPQALEILGIGSNIDAVLLDLSMPSMNGMELLKRLNLDDSAPPCAVMTASEMQADAIQALRYGAFDYIVKPCTRSAIEECMRRAENILKDQESNVIPDTVLESLQFTFDSRRRAVPQVVNRVLKHPHSRLLQDRRLRNELKIAMLESLNNAVIHGNLGISSDAKKTGDWQTFEDAVSAREASPEWADKKVNLEVRFEKERVSMIVTDEGAGFDPATLPDLSDPLDTEECGRGVMLIRQVMDQVAWNRSGNQMVMVKQFSDHNAKRSRNGRELEKTINPVPALSIFA